jgi:hypothetical protein
MSATRICCHVLEVPDQDDWLSRRGSGPRELLPWADPYIAGLMRRLESRFSPADDLDLCDPFAGYDEPASTSVFDDGWQDDAFMPRPLEAPRFHSYPPVYGGFPLLEDGCEPCDADTY